MKPENGYMIFALFKITKGLLKKQLFCRLKNCKRLTISEIGGLSAPLKICYKQKLILKDGCFEKFHDVFCSFAQNFHENVYSGLALKKPCGLSEAEEKIAQKCNKKIGFCYQFVINFQNIRLYLKNSKKGLNFIAL